MREFEVQLVKDVSFNAFGDSWDVRIEVSAVVGEAGLFRLRLWRLEYFRIQSTFPQFHGKPAHQPSDHKVLVFLDESILYPEFVRGETAREVFEQAKGIVENFKKALVGSEGAAED